MKGSVLVMILVTLFVASCSDDAEVESISGLYVAGNEHNGKKYVAKYWKNGKGVVLTDGTENASGDSIVISGSDIYVAGYENSGSNNVAKYWKNKTGIALTDGTQNAYAKAMVLVP